jgi:hypothetical protein
MQSFGYTMAWWPRLGSTSDLLQLAPKPWPAGAFDASRPPRHTNMHWPCISAATWSGSGGAAPASTVNEKLA